MTCNQRKSEIVYDYAFIEESVFLKLKYHGDNSNTAISHEFNKAKEAIYHHSSIDQRNSSFEQLYEKYFYQLKIHGVFDHAVDRFPLLHQEDVRIYVKKVWSKAQEDTELFVSAQTKTVCIAVMVECILHPVDLENRLLRDLMRVSDMLDPNFQYNPYIVLAGKNELEDNFIKDRFRILWDIYIAARLVQRGYSNIKRDALMFKFEKAFFYLDEKEREVIQKELNGLGLLTQSQLIKWAQDPKSIQSLGEGGIRCPLCDFTSFEPINDLFKEDSSMIDLIHNDYPQWRTEQGICLQCFDLYSSQIKMQVK